MPNDTKRGDRGCRGDPGCPGYPRPPRSPRQPRPPRSYNVDLPSREPPNQSQPEGHVAPSLFARVQRLERERGPRQRIGRARHRQAFVRMPDAVLIAVIEKPVVELGPPLVAAEVSHTARDLEPGEGPWDIGIGGVSMRQGNAHQ